LELCESNPDFPSHAVIREMLGGPDVMTAQRAENLLNEHPRLRLDGLKLYAIIRGDPRDNYGWGEKFEFPVPPSPPANRAVCSAWWRGYVATFRLNADGTLDHVRYEYSVSIDNWVSQEVNARLTGDFWLRMAPTFFGPKTFIPFRGGRIVEDRDEWYDEPERGKPYSAE
jgi:hypothetical protein